MKIEPTLNFDPRAAGGQPNAKLETRNSPSRAAGAGAYPTRIWNVVEAVMLPSETFTVMLELPVFPRVGVTFTVLSDDVPANVTRDMTAGLDHEAESVS